MTRNLHLAFLAALLGPAGLAGAQDQTHPATTDTTDKSSSKNAKPSQNTKTSADDADAPKKSSANDNPFPEEQSKQAAKAVEQGGTAPVPADMQGDPTPAPRDGDGVASDNSGDEGVSSSRTRLEGLNDTDPDAGRTEKTKITSVAHNPKLAKEDVAIGKMYMQSENYKGAYIRYKEALSLDPDSADAAFGIAESARKMNQTQEAIANYQLCLDLDPRDPAQRRLARRFRSCRRSQASKLSGHRYLQLKNLAVGLFFTAD